MIIRLLLIFFYLVFCIRYRVNPCRYFQLNANYFNEQKNIFSKLDMDQHIPERWRLNQHLDTGSNTKLQYPVFVKPDWGQNSRGIHRADSAVELTQIRHDREKSKVNYLVQEAAPGKREFEIFIIHSINNTKQPSIISVTETLNNSSERYPINGIYNQATTYSDITNQFSPEQIKLLWSYFQQVGHFRICRFGLRTNSVSALLNGDFHIIEVNLFLPMPLALIAKSHSRWERALFCMHCMRELALATKNIPSTQPYKQVFFKKLRIYRSLLWTNEMRPFDESV